MPRKITDNTPTETTLKLLVYLLANDGYHTLTDLAEKYDISKQTVIRSLERHDLSFFGKLIKERFGKEVAYMLDKTNLITRLKRASGKSERQFRAKSGLKLANAGRPGCFGAKSLKKRIRPAIERMACNDPFTLAVLEYMGFDYFIELICGKR